MLGGFVDEPQVFPFPLILNFIIIPYQQIRETQDGMEGILQVPCSLYSPRVPDSQRAHSACFQFDIQHGQY